MVEFAPSTGGLALRAGHRDLPADTPAPPIATDGDTIFYGAAFERLPLGAQTGLVAHEVLHVALRHPQRLLALQGLLGDVDARLFNLCADAIVDSTLGHLGWLKLPAASVGLDGLLATVLGIAQPVEASLLEWDVERLYRRIDDRAAAKPGDGGGPRGARPAASRREDGPHAARARALAPDAPLDLLPAAGDAQRPEHETQQSRDWQERVLRAHASTLGPVRHARCRRWQTSRQSWQLQLQRHQQRAQRDHLAQVQRCPRRWRARPPGWRCGLRRAMMGASSLIPIPPA
jgi:hypothetical protein